jgi:hypothetical protein
MHRTVAPSRTSYHPLMQLPPRRLHLLTSVTRFQLCSSSPHSTKRMQRQPANGAIHLPHLPPLLPSTPQQWRPHHIGPRRDARSDHGPLGLDRPKSDQHRRFHGLPHGGALGASHRPVCSASQSHPLALPYMPKLILHNCQLPRLHAWSPCPCSIVGVPLLALFPHLHVNTSQQCAARGP